MQAAETLFEIRGKPAQLQFQVIEDSTLQSQSIELTKQLILEELGIEVELPTTSADIDLVYGRFGLKFPNTADLSKFARELSGSDPKHPDEMLLAWIGRETSLFRALEKVGVDEKLNKGFTDVDDFLTFSLSIQNRRKSRMGHSFEHHLAALFEDAGLKFDRQVKTEGKNKPDFIFPGKIEYHNGTFNPDLLVMLASKSTCKDRWRQVLTEAIKIPLKHLCTLEPGISKDQTDEMKLHSVLPVIPKEIQKTYTQIQLNDILSVEEFIDFVAQKEKSAEV